MVDDHLDYLCVAIAIKFMVFFANKVEFSCNAQCWQVALARLYAVCILWGLPIVGMGCGCEVRMVE